MQEGWRPLRVEESPDDIIKAGYHVGVDEDTHVPITDASVDWSPDDFKMSDEKNESSSPPGESTTPVNSTEGSLTEESTTTTENKEESSRETPAEESLPGSETSEGSGAHKELDADDIFNRFETPADKTTTGETQPGDNPSTDATASENPKPEEEKSNLTTAEKESLTPGKDRLGKFTEAEFKQAMIFVRIAHHLIQNGNAWAMQAVVGEGEINEYKSFNKENFELWTQLGTELCAKYGFLPPLELSYMASGGQNLGPAWQLAIKLNKEKKKSAKLEDENRKLKWENYIMNNADLIAKAKAEGKTPDLPPDNYTTTKTPKGKVVKMKPEEEESETDEPNLEEKFKEEMAAEEWTLNEKTSWWHHSDGKRKYPAVDGDYIFSAEKGAMIHRTTAKTKTGKPKGKKSKIGNQQPKWRDPDRDGAFMNKDDIAFAKSKGFTQRSIRAGWRKAKSA